MIKHYIKKLWHDPVWSKIISTIIIAAGTAICPYVFNWWPVIGRYTIHLNQLALKSTPVPNWLLLLSMLAIVRFSIFVLGAVFHKKSMSRSFSRYTTDTFFDLKWRWKYLNNGQIINAATFCPVCDYQVYAQDVSSYDFIDQIAFHCDNCKRDLGTFDESFKSLEDKTVRLIQQKIRTESWNDKANAE